MNLRSRVRVRVAGVGAWIAAAVLVLGTSTPQARAGLEEYVKRPDPAFAWEVVGKYPSPRSTIYELRLTSQVWQGITWTHQLVIYEPSAVKYEGAMLLFISGGANPVRPGVEEKDAAQGFALAELCGARCAILRQTPNQPLLGDRKEDDLISETFVRYLETKDENWPLLFPMVKGAVRAMDALQAWAKQEGKPDVTKFVVSGASKRGWTTWLTGAVDDRVVAIAPMVIVTLNMRAQNPHQLEVWGKYSEQIDDYVRRGLMERMETPDGLKLWAMIDPYTYRDRLTIPKWMINGTNDRYWTLDSLNLYWDDLKGPKFITYLPNAGHGLDQHRDYATHAVGALFRHAVPGRPLPQLSWTHDDAPDGSLRLTVRSDPAPKSAQLWTARSATLDFRDSEWTPAPLPSADGAWVGTVSRPESGNVALFGDLEYEVDGLPFHLSTQIRQTGLKGEK